MCIAVDCGMPTRLHRNVTPGKKETRCYQFIVLVNQSHKLVIYQIYKLVQKKLLIGNHFLVFLPFPGYKIQNSDSVGICETQLTEAF